MTFRRLVFLASVASLQVLVPIGAAFAWQGNGTPVCTAPGIQQFPSGIPDGGGGAFFVWLDARGGSKAYVQRLLSDGSVAPGWPVDGMPLTTIGGATGQPRIFPDGTGGVLALFQHGGPRVQRVDANGLIYAGFPADGKLLGVTFTAVTSISAPDGVGGAYFAGIRGGMGPFGFQTEAIVERIDSNGNLVWSPNGVNVVVGDNGGGVRSIEPSASGDAIWSAFTRWDLQVDQVHGYVGRIRKNGVIAQGIQVFSLAGGIPPGNTYDFATSDGANGILGVWRDQTPGPPYTIPTADFAARWDSASVYTGWTIPNAQGPPITPIADGTGGGGYMVGKPEGDNSLVAFRRTPAGGFPSGWSAAGIPLSEPDATSGSAIGVIAGSLLVSWAESFGAGSLDIRATILMPNGTLPAGWPAGGMDVCTAIGNQDFPRLIVNPGLSAIVVWEDQRTNAITQTDIYASMLPIGIVPAQAALVEASAEAGIVRLHWFSPDGTGLVATLEREARGSGFTPIATLSADGSGHLRYEDHEVSPGGVYAYRLVVDDGGRRATLGEVTIEVPFAPRLAIEPARPNPSSGAVTLAYTLASAAPARLEMFDLSGRRVFAREFAAPSAGRHLLRVDESLAPGVYLVRLTQDDRWAAGRVVRAE